MCNTYLLFVTFLQSNVPMSQVFTIFGSSFDVRPPPKWHSINGGALQSSVWQKHIFGSPSVPAPVQFSSVSPLSAHE